MEKAGMVSRERTVYGADFMGNWAHRRDHYAITKAEYDAAR